MKLALSLVMVISCSEAEFFNETTQIQSVEKDDLGGESEGDDQLALASKTRSETRQQTFDQKQRGVLDILLVIDNSGSMRPIQKKLQQNLANLLEAITDSNWQIAVIGTKRADCLQRTVINKNTNNYQQEYARLVDLGASGDGEYLVYSAIRGLDNICDGQQGKAWLRDGSSIAVLMVSDQDNECGAPFPLPNNARCSIDDLRAHLNKLRPDNNARVYGLVDSNNASLDRWQDFSIFSSHGSVFSQSYDHILQNISRDVSTMLLDQFRLESLPIAGSVTVEVDGDQLENHEYSVSGQNIVFDQGYLPEENTRITVSYTTEVVE